MFRLGNSVAVKKVALMRAMSTFFHFLHDLFVPLFPLTNVRNKQDFLTTSQYGESCRFSVIIPVRHYKSRYRNCFAETYRAIGRDNF